MLTRIEQISKRLDDIFKKRIKYSVNIIKKKNKVIFKIKDGIIMFNIDMIPVIKCNYCNSNFCDHILYLLSNYFYLSDFTISYMFFQDIYNDFILMLHNVNNNILEDLIVKSLKKQMCGICHLDLGAKKYDYHLFYCDKCKNMVHNSCMEEWINRKMRVGINGQESNVEKGCIYCKNIDFLPNI